MASLDLTAAGCIKYCKYCLLKLPDSKSQRSEVMVEEVIKHRTVHLPYGSAAHTAFLRFGNFMKPVSGIKEFGMGMCSWLRLLDYTYYDFTRHF